MQVQNTNDSSIVSKLSSARVGYFQDDYLETFVHRQQKRSPVINRGYYIRFKAMEAIFESWFSFLSSNMPSKEYQIISLGAGFDSSYFRLKDLNRISSKCKYVEIDFPEVMKRKLNCLENAALKRNFDFSDKHVISDPAVVSSTGEYTMLGINLKDTKELNRCFALIGIDFSIPTLILSECVVTYMDLENSSDLIKWFQKHFPDSTFVAYEQIRPFDAFGIVMQNHFNSIACPLKSLLVYSNEEKQYWRYINMGWLHCNVIEMYSFFMSLPDDERTRIQTLELFDEFEVWHEKCHHYVLVCASQGQISFSDVFKAKALPINKINIQAEKMKWKFHKAHDLLFRFGHQVLPVSSSWILIAGGFGDLCKRHQRLGGLTLYDFNSGKCFLAQVLDTKNNLNKRMFHTMTRLSNGAIVLIGGRSAPNKVFKDLVVLNFPEYHSEQSMVVHTDEWISPETTFSVFVCGSGLPSSPWRHSANLVKLDGVEHIVIFGGRTVQQCATNQCCILNTSNWNWSEVSLQQHTPSPRHSHSSVTYKESKIIVTGGLSANESILNSVHILDCQTSMWTTLQISGLLPRYSHTSHFLNDKIFLIGGITCASGWSLGIGIINLTTLQAIEIAAPVQNPEHPILLCNHSSCVYKDQIVTIGGGGNCFSFGTHFNRQLAFIDIKNFL